VTVERFCDRNWSGQPNTPGFFVSVASKGLTVYANGLESTLAGTSIGVDSKEVARGEEDNSGTANFEGGAALPGSPGLKLNV
jgi:hypothetical protein